MEHMGNCMAPERMPCTLEGQTYEPGSEVRRECGSCKCEMAGKWKCTNEGCAARCEVYGIQTLTINKYTFHTAEEYSRN